MTRRLLVIGGDAAGMSAASRARRLLGPEELEIVAFERSPHTSYSACGLPYLASRVVEDPESLIARSPQEFAERHSIDARVFHEVMGIDLETKRVTVADLRGGSETDEEFDDLMVATGTVPIRPEIEGIDSKGIFGMSTLQSGINLRMALDEERPERAVVVGGGYIGLEAAEAMVGRRLETSLVEALDQPMSSLDADMAALITTELSAAGVKVHLEEPVLAFERRGERVSAVVTTERTIETDLVVLGLGTAPNVELARKAGLDIGESGAIFVDDRLSTRSEGIWAAGDCAEQVHRVTGKPVNFHLGTIANKMGRIAGVNIAGGRASFPGVLGTAITKVFSLEVARTGLSSLEAEQSGLDFTGETTEARTRSGYYPGSDEIRVKVLAERPSGRLLGAQIVGGAGAGKRIDVFAAALWNEMTVDDLSWMDLSYAPPFAPVWDPVLIAARKAAEAV